MKKKVVFTVILFIICIGAIKYTDIVQRYEIEILDYFKYSRALTATEKNFLASRDIQYGIDINDAPFAFVSSDTDQNTGILVDYFNQLSVTLENNFHPVTYDNYHLAVKLKDGAIDAAVLNKTAVNEHVFLFTQALYTERSKILVSGDSSFETIDDVRDISIAVISGSTAHHAGNQFFGDVDSVDLVLTDDLDESFYLLGMGEVDAILGDEAKISYYLNSALKVNRFKFLEGSISEEEVCVAVNKNQEVLYNILNKGILELKKTNQYNHIHSKWFGSFIPEVKDVSDYGSTANGLIAMLCVLLVMLLWNQTVSNRVDIKTRELHESREELRNIMDNLTDGIVVTDADDTVQVCNQSILTLLSLPEEQVVGKKLDEVKGLQPYLNHANDLAALRMDNRYFLVFKRKLDDSSGKNLLFIEDYTERHKYESLTRQEAKMIAVGELSAGLAHEIRNPLGLIKSYIYVIRKKLTDGMGAHAVQVIDDSVDRINNLIENLLGFSRLSVEKTSLINVEELIWSMVMLEQKRLEKNGIDIQVDFNLEGGSELKVNEDVLKLTIVNLFNNSIDALLETERKGKKIAITVSDAGGKLQMDFEDNGDGISKENMEAIFNPFFTTKEAGTGLGLYILNSEIRGVDGSITADSVEGEGTCFHIVLPIEREVQNGE
ncbi:MAG: transporter substrate-binding domain-containing protein [Firmicutes bacterium]|nr:transporter substrate-binding domain-containing protein [Bacillota bacterium]